MDTVHAVKLKCPTCGREGVAHWAHPRGGRPGRRRLLSLTKGFIAARRGGGREPEILCEACNALSKAAKENP